MGLLRSLVETRSSNPEDPKTPLSDPSVVTHFPGARETHTGRIVSPEGSLAVSGVYACVRIIAEGAAMTTPRLQRMVGDAFEDASDDRRASLLTDAPNPETDAGEFWRSVLVWLLLRGNAYVYVERDGNARPTGLWVLPASAVEPFRMWDGRIVYQVALDQETHAGDLPKTTVVGETDIMHYRAFGLGRLKGISPIGAVRQSVGIALAAQEYQGRFYANDATPGGYLATDHALTDEQFDRLEKSWLASHQGLASAHKPAILEDGVKWHNMSLPPGDAEFINSRRWELSEIARIFGVPPHMLGDQERQTSYGTGVDEQNRGFVKHSLAPWVSRLERVTRHKLLIREPDPDPQLWFRFDMDALMRGDPRARAEAHATGRQWGWLSINDIRRDEGLAPVDGGDDYLEPENMRPVRGDDEEDPRDLRERIEAASTAWQAGFDPQSIVDRLDLGMQHSGAPSPSAQPQEASLRSLERRDDDPDVSWTREHERALRRYFEHKMDVLLERQGDESPPRSVDDHWDDDEWNDELTGLFRRLGGLTAAAFAARVMDDYDPDSEMGEWLAANSRIGAEQVNESAKEYVNERMASPDDGEATSGKVLRGAFGVLSTSRAAQIARSRVTTVGRAAEHGAAEKSGEVTHKTWRVMSGDPRDEHAPLDGERVELGERFSNGARWPGDPDLDVGERANCRCDMDFD